MNFSIKNVLVFTFVLLVQIAATGQSNPDQKSFTLIPGQNFEFSFYSYNAQLLPSYIIEHFNGNILEDNIVAPADIGQNKFRITFTVNPDFLGETSLTVVYYENEGMWDEPRYMTLNFHVVESYIVTKHDYKSVLFGDGAVEIDVVSNDYTTHGPLTLTDFSLVQNGQAEIVNGQTLRFTPNAEIRGMGYVNYVVQNDLGFTENGTVSICILDPEYAVDFEEIRLTTTNKSSISILLPADGFEFGQGESPGLGDAVFIGSDVIEYTPHSSSAGEDIFTLTQSSFGLERRVVVQILDPGEDKGSVRDDEVFTEINHAVDFNVFDNDLVSTNSITSYSNELNYLGNGEFTYTPPANYSGIKHFYYTTYNNFEFQTGDIQVVISNFYPETLLRYELKTRENTPLILNYAVPIDEYDFQALSNPGNGNLSVLSGVKTVDYDCGTETGLNLIVYQPSANFTGLDEFDLQYCISGDCKVVKIAVSVVDSDQCGCAGSDCVWPGDSNNDGRISIADLLPLGYHLGASGPGRNESDPASWIGQFSDDWTEFQSATGQNAKFIDANGDGLITVDDTIGISGYYDQYHNLVSRQELVIKEYPFVITPNSTSLNEGDLLELQIEIGSEQYPVLNLHGIAYTLDINPQYVDSSSVYAKLHDEWFGYNSPTIHMIQQPKDGKIDIGSTRTTGLPINGKGLVHTVGLIVEEDLDGLREDGKLVRLPILIRDIICYGEDGKMYVLPDVETHVEIILEHSARSVPVKSKVILYPNPSSDYLNIHLNGNDVIAGIEIFGISGQKLGQINQINSKHYQIPTGDFADGLYIARIQTATTTFTQKFKVSKE